MERESAEPARMACHSRYEFAIGKLAKARPERRKFVHYSAARMPRCLERRKIPRQLEELSLRHGGRGTPILNIFLPKKYHDTARAVRNRTTGVLYVLDEPSIGLHPSNLEGLIGVMDDLIADGNTVVLVDHDTQVLSHADWIVELGPEAGAKGGNVIALGTVADVCANPDSRIGPFLQRTMEERRG